MQISQKITSMGTSIHMSICVTIKHLQNQVCCFWTIQPDHPIDTGPSIFFCTVQTTASMGITEMGMHHVERKCIISSEMKNRLYTSKEE